MNSTLYTKLLQLGEEHSHPEDPTHDFSHIQRVLKNAEVIAVSEGGDLDILVPAALFHDVVNYPKTDPCASRASDESAAWTVALLKTFPDYPQEKCDAVYDAIAKCSFNKGIVPTLLESKILQDADGLEATGAISILRTFASTGQYKRSFYNSDDTFCVTREPNPLNYALDLFYARLLKIIDRIHTPSARVIAERRHAFLLTFLEEFKLELAE
ncbi:phosphohydrolase [soil metagenome]